jgi:hypothetical protein
MGLFFPHKLQAHALESPFDPFKFFTRSKFYVIQCRIFGAVALLMFFYMVWMAIHGRIIVEHYSK